MNEIVAAIAELQAKDPKIRFRYDEDLKVITYLRGNIAESARNTKTLHAQALKILKDNAVLFGRINTKELSVLDEITGDNEKNLILQQYHGKARVFGGSVRFRVSRNVINTVSNHLFPDLENVPKDPKVGAEEAVKIAQDAVNTKTEPQGEPELLVYRYEKKPHLVWEVKINEVEAPARRKTSSILAGRHGAPAHYIVYVDAIRGKVLFFYDNIQTAGPVVGNGTGYYSGAGTVNAWFNDSTNQLRDTTRTGGGGPEIITNDEDGASPSEDADNNWNDTSTSPRHNNQGAEVDAHRYAGDVVDYFQTVHGRNSFNGTGANCVIVSHLGTNYSNGYWDGSKVNLGDGSGVAATGDDYECSDDWLAHEFTHGYTQYTCGLTYLNESGALNEAFSDVFAAFITGDWLVFEDAWLKASAPAWRNMIEPTNGGMWNGSSDTNAINSVLAGHQPSHYSVRYTGTFDNGGVHINSGIINNLFYLLTVGGTHTVSAVTVAGIGQSAAERLLFRCMTVNLVGNPNATFLDFREAMLDACLDLFPTDLVKLSQVKNAFNAVGIGPDLYVRDNTADSGVEPFPGSYLWASPDVINRTAVSPSPAVDFADMTSDSLWQNVEFGQNNHIYVRLQNRGSSNGDASINVYFIPATSFATPASWIFIGTLNELAIAPGSVRISGPLTFPSALIPAPGHYCMLAVVSDPLDPAPDHTLITSVSEYISFVRNTNNMAYRNMDVVNDVLPGTPGVLEVIVGAFDRRERFDIRIDSDQFIPGAVLRVRGPREVLDGAIGQGFKLVARREDQNIYEFAPELVKKKQQSCDCCCKRDERAKDGYGFDDILVEKPFKIQVEYIIPKDNQNRRAYKQRYPLAVRQLWHGQAVGAAGIYVEPPKNQ